MENLSGHADCELFGQIRANATAFIAAQLAEVRQS
jgi:hypothetical protein